MLSKESLHIQHTQADGIVMSGNASSKRQSAREKIAGAARSTGKIVKDAAVFAGDLNRDGKVDQQDARIAAGKAKKVASATAAGAGKLGKKVLQHDKTPGMFQSANDRRSYCDNAAPSRSRPTNGRRGARDNAIRFVERQA